MQIAEQLASSAIAFVLIREPDAPYDNQAMAIGIVPMERSKKTKKILASLSLAGGEHT